MALVRDAVLKYLKSVEWIDIRILVIGKNKWSITIITNGDKR